MKKKTHEKLRLNEKLKKNKTKSIKETTMK
jgi:hypothetical protein